MSEQPPRCLIIAAHPDDECLWFSGVASAAERIVLAFVDSPADPAMGQRRRAALAEHPDRARLAVLGLPEPGLFKAGDWSQSPPVFADPQKQRAATRLSEALEARLTPLMSNGIIRVYTHAPWGDYGHEEHALLSATVRRLANRLGIEVWVPLYGSLRALGWIGHHLNRMSEQMILVPTDRAWADGVQAVYARHHCWTWEPDWRGFAMEGYVRLTGPSESGGGYLPPLALVDLAPKCKAASGADAAASPAGD
ncbi:hypothetical protein JCM17960_11820 [Magnetospira thiophila]